jgi:thiamine kinase-like enzyme
MIDLSLNSHSQDLLEVVNSEGIFLVNKVFKSNIDRAKRNVEKQKNFNAIYAGSTRIFSAEVLNFEEIENQKAVLTMPYIEGITGPSYAIHATPLLAKSLSSALSSILLTELTNINEVTVSSKYLLEKIGQVADSTFDVKLKELIFKGYKWVQLLPENLIFPMGSCHGDLTLSNIIFNPVDGIILIDFLDTFLESPLQDVAKIKQDFVYGWSFRKCHNTLRVKADILCNSCMPKIIKSIEIVYKQQVDVLTLLALLRIAPYIIDEVTHRWLINSLTDWFEKH